MPVSLTGPREIIHCEMISYGSQRIRPLTMETAVVCLYNSSHDILASLDGCCIKCAPLYYM
jgi:hypothetical protein